MKDATYNLTLGDLLHHLHIQITNPTFLFSFWLRKQQQTELSFFQSALPLYLISLGTHPQLLRVLLFMYGGEVSCLVHL
jgi:hypothetical protein